MTTRTVVRSRFPRLSANFRRYAGSAARTLDRSGQMGWFSFTTVKQIPWALKNYRTEALRLWTEGSAWFSGEAEQKGRIARGRLAEKDDDLGSTARRQVDGRL